MISLLNANIQKLNKTCSKYSLTEFTDLHSSKDEKYFLYINSYSQDHQYINAQYYSWFGDFEQITYKNPIDYLQITKTNKLEKFQSKNFPKALRAMDIMSQYFNYFITPKKIINTPFIFKSTFLKKDDKIYVLIIQNLINVKTYTTYSELTPEQMNLFSQGNTLKLGDNYLIPANAPGLISNIDKYVNQQAKLDDIASNHNKAYTITDVSIMNNIFDKLTK